MALLNKAAESQTGRKPAAERIMQSLRCANPGCNQTIAKVHFYGPGGAFQVLECPKCRHGTEYVNTPNGVEAYDLGAGGSNGARKVVKSVNGT